ncbi:TetR/AcrR family transcriptional regulator C-terminal domain-containing protein [Streptomyces sp. FIT100]|uniref:TetR/AcrR family transcriptional regulator C-terminal domain-containing protein n=1 Tax=Streptomyces sp. FIT100 TaxID=2837956 RepID=UPI0021C85355|nr:TetR/AcrR family transcriptional regulator C-terminal domain-containing protein [Streptomyces sp. FIT100]
MAHGTRRELPRTREPLTRERIVGAALAIIDEEGVDALSMRRIAARLGVQAMSLYNHVRSKADILDGVTEFITTEMRMPRRMTGGWEDGIRSIAYAFRQASLRHPRACELVLMRQLSTPTALAPVDTMLAMMLDHGFDEETAVHALRLFISFQVGTLLRQFHGSTALGGGAADEGDTAAREAVRTAYFADSGFPAVAKVAPVLAVNDHEAEFAFGVELLIDALGNLAPTPPSGS